MSRVYPVQFTVPAGTAIAAPVTQPVVLEDNRLDTVRIIIPDGHVGLTGLRISWGGTNVFPIPQGSWVISNNEIIDWPADQEVTETGLSVVGYNLDVFPHSFYMRFQISDLTSHAVAAIQSGQVNPAATAAASLAISGLSVVNIPAGVL